MENSGDIDIDQVIDVPDTPDRLAARNVIRQRSIGNGSDTSVSRDHGNSIFLLRGRSRLPLDDGHNRGLDFRSHRSVDNPRVPQHQNNAILHISDSPPVSSNSNTYNRMVAGQIPKHNTINSSGGKLMGKGKALSHKNHMKESTFQEGKADPDLMEQTRYSRINGKAFMQGSLNDPLDEQFKEGSTTRNGSSHCMPNSSKASSISHKGKEMACEDTHSALGIDHWKGIDIIGGFPPKTGKLLSASLHSIPSPRITGQKRLVRNGCISPLNIAKAKQSVQPKENSSGSKDVANTNTGNLVSRSPTCVIDISDTSAESNKHVGTKGKGLILHSSSIRELGEKNSHFPDSSIKHNSEANGASDVNAELSLCSEELEGWRNTGYRPRKIDLPIPSKDINPPRIHHAASTLIKRQKKHESSSSNHNEYSTPGLDDSEIIFPRSSVESSNSRSNRNLRPRHRTTLDPLVEVDEVMPQMGSHNSQHTAHKNNAASDARARQLEADEILALELQEQFYQETPTDAHIAWTFQQEEATVHASSSGSHGQLHSRRSSTSAVQRQPRPRSLQNPSSRTRIDAREPTSSRIAQFRGRIRSRTPSYLRRRGNLYPFPPDMDLDTRLDILEALEATFGDFADMTMGNRGLQVQRDFNENDYEMLLALDENNHQHGGARVDQINRLPQSIVQSDNSSEEPCAICLETPAAGETIRHLPCFHKFHKDCIDPWLNRKTSCPVCKSSIT